MKNLIHVLVCSFVLLSMQNAYSATYSFDSHCKMTMTDNLNLNADGEPTVAVLEAVILGANNHLSQGFVTNQSDPYYQSEGLQRVDMLLNFKGPIWVDAGVPEITLSEMLKNYEMVNDEQLTFVALEGACTDLQRSMIFFMVMEWFYFG